MSLTLALVVVMAMALILSGLAALIWHYFSQSYRTRQRKALSGQSDTSEINSATSTNSGSSQRGRTLMACTEHQPLEQAGSLTVQTKAQGHYATWQYDVEPSISPMCLSTQGTKLVVGQPALSYRRYDAYHGAITLYELTGADNQAVLPHADKSSGPVDHKKLHWQPYMHRDGQHAFGSFVVWADDETVIVGGTHGNLEALRLHTNEHGVPSLLQLWQTPKSQYGPHKRPVALSASEEVVVSLSQDGQLEIRQVETGHTLQVLPLQPSDSTCGFDMYSVAVSPRGEIAVGEPTAANGCGAVHLFAVQKGASVRSTESIPAPQVSTVPVTLRLPGLDAHRWRFGAQVSFDRTGERLLVTSGETGACVFTHGPTWCCEKYQRELENTYPWRPDPWQDGAWYNRLGQHISCT